MKLFNECTFIYECEAISEVLLEEANDVIGNEEKYGYVRSIVLIDFSMISSVSMATITEEGKTREIADVYLSGVMYTLNEDYEDVVRAFVESRSTHTININ